MEGGIHMIDLMLFLTEQRPTTVSALGNKITTRNSAFKYKDFSIANYVFENGLIGKISSNFGCVHPHQRHKNIWNSYFHI